MNLLTEKWIVVQDLNGNRRNISPRDVAICTEANEIIAPRADFRGALHQFLVGLLQTTFAPRNFDDWKRLWTAPPSEAQLQEAFTPYQDAFELESEGPAFMQDFSLPDAEPNGIAALLIESPGDKTHTENLDHFVHHGAVQAICPTCAALALFTLQINAPSGGAGHRVSVRGGGPLTTLLMPANPQASLWQKLWLNVLPQDYLGYPQVVERGHVLPWLVPTRTSDAQGIGNTTPECVHPLQAYWSMPRRILLDFSDLQVGCCDLCGMQSERLIRHYRTRNYGTNYTGSWLHPLTPYSFDSKGAKGENPPLSIKGQKGGIGYRHWLGFALGNEQHQPDAARVVAHFNAYIRRASARLWCFGYDMDNMKARCWYDSVLPLHDIPPEMQKYFMKVTKGLLDVAQETAGQLHKYVKAAWFECPGDTGSEPTIHQSFWQNSEADFYTLLEKLSQTALDDEAEVAPLYKQWLASTRFQAMRLFDAWVLAAPIEDMDMKRVVRARAGLGKGLASAKPMKDLQGIVKDNQKETA